MGIDPVTHKPFQPASPLAPPQQPEEEENAAVTAKAGPVSGAGLKHEAFCTEEVPMAHLLDDLVVSPCDVVGGGAPPAANSSISTAYSPESSSSSSYSTSAAASSGGSSIVDGEWPEWPQMVEWPESMWLDDVVPAPAQWELGDPFVTYPRIALFDHQESLFAY